MVLLSLITTIPAAIFAEPVITLTFGSSFASAAGVAQVMLLSVPLVVIANAWLPFLYQRREERRVARAVTPIMLLGSGIIMLLTAVAGPTGAAAAYAVRALAVAVILRVMLWDPGWLPANRNNPRSEPLAPD